MNLHRAEILSDHNQYRTIHGSSPLRFDDALNRLAQAHAHQLANNECLTDSTVSYSQSVYCGSGHPPTRATHVWYNEILNYNEGDPTHVAGRFTALVWRSSEFLGVGIAKSRCGKAYVVAIYSPCGNEDGQYAENVRPAVFSPLVGDVAGRCFLKSFKEDKYVRAHSRCGEWKVDVTEHAMESGRWIVEDRGGKVSLKCRCVNLFLSADLDGHISLSKEVTDCELWTPFKNHNGSISFLSTHGRWLSCHRADKLLSTATSNQRHEHFSIVKCFYKSNS